MKAMIFAAGLGTRLKPFTESAPKALARVAGKSLLERAIGYLRHAGIFEIIVNVHHFAPMVREVVTKNNGFGSSITISDESDGILETGGGLLKARQYFENESDFVVMNVDVLTSLNLTSLINAHRQHDATAMLAVMNRSSSRQLLFDNDWELCGWENQTTGEKRMARQASGLKPFAFSGIQVLSNEIWDGSSLNGKFSLIDLYLEQAATKKIMGFDHSGDKFIDVGKPGSIEQAETLFRL